MEAEEFSKAFLAKMASCSWSQWLHTPEAQAHFIKKDIDPALVKRYTSYQTGSKPTIKEATELYCFRNTDPDDCRRLIAVIENVILDHLGIS